MHIHDYSWINDYEKTHKNVIISYGGDGTLLSTIQKKK